MDELVDTAGGCNGFRHSRRQFRADDGHIGKNIVADDTLLSWARLSDSMAMLVTSEPVPAVVGIAMTGGPFTGTKSVPNRFESILAS